MLGATQLSWFEQSLLDAQTRGISWKFVAISSPIDQIGPIGGSFTVTNADGTYRNTESDGGKSWMGGYRSERNALLQFIADHHIDHVVFLTTDDHQVRVNELGYFAVAGDQSTYTRVPDCFQILVGPLGAGGPDGITDHRFANIQSIAESFGGQQGAFGVDPIGLDPAFPGLSNVYREGDPEADALRQPVDFYSPDTFNYARLDVSPDGGSLTVSAFGIDSFAANTFPEPDQVGPERLILSFQINRTAGSTWAAAPLSPASGTVTVAPSPLVPEVWQSRLSPALASPTQTRNTADNLATVALSRRDQESVDRPEHAPDQHRGGATTAVVDDGMAGTELRGSLLLEADALTAPF
jgi:hypothetical protein